MFAPELFINLKTLGVKIRTCQHQFQIKKEKN